MLYNVMGKRQLYERHFTSEVRTMTHYDYKIFYWQDVIRDCNFKTTTVTDWGLKLSCSISERYDKIKTVDDLVGLVRELDVIDNGRVHSDSIDWYKVVKDRLKFYDDEAKKITDDIQKSNERLKTMTEKEIEELLESEVVNFRLSNGNDEKRRRKLLINEEIKRRATVIKNVKPEKRKIKKEKVSSKIKRDIVSVEQDLFKGVY